MPSAHDVVNSLKQRITHEKNRITEIRGEMEKLSAPYNRYVDLVRELEERRERTKRIVAVLGMSHTDAVAYQLHDRELEVTPRSLRENLRLWEAVEQFLFSVKEARVGEIQDFLEAVKYSYVSRQAIESAVKAHPKVFRVFKRGVERYIALRHGLP